MVRVYDTARFIKPYRDPAYKCTGFRYQGLMKWAILRVCMVFFFTLIVAFVWEVPLEFQFFPNEPTKTEPSSLLKNFFLVVSMLGYTSPPTQLLKGVRKKSFYSPNKKVAVFQKIIKSIKNLPLINTFFFLSVTMCFTEEAFLGIKIIMDTLNEDQGQVK